MKKLLVFFFLMPVFTALAQEISSYGKPASMKVLLYNTRTEAQIPLENTIGIRKNKNKIGGLGGNTMSYIIEGERSTIRLKADSAVFVMESGSGTLGAIDPTMSITLYMLEIKDGKRVAIMNEYKPGFNPLSLVTNKAGDKSKNTDTKINYKSTPLKEGFTQLKPEKKLEPGEYAFVGGYAAGNNFDENPKNYKMNDIKYMVFAFAID